MTRHESNGLKKYLAGVVVAILVHTAALGYWAGQISQSVEHNAKTNERQDAALADIKNWFLPSHPPDRRTP